MKMKKLWKGFFPDSLRILRNMLGSRGNEDDTKFKLQSICRNRYVWVDTSAVPKIVVEEHDPKLSSRQARK